MDTQVNIKEETCVKYERATDTLQASMYNPYVDIKQSNREKVKQEDVSVELYSLQIKSENEDQKAAIKNETDHIDKKLESLDNEEFDIKTEDDGVLVNQTNYTPIQEKPFQCNICNYSCSWKSYLQRHMQIHSGVKLFQCGTCDCKFSRKSSLQMHMKLHTGEKPFQCGICDYKFSRKDSLQMHMKIHTGEKPFQCDICHYKCLRKSYLRNHMKIHTGRKPCH